MEDSDIDDINSQDGQNQEWKDCDNQNSLIDDSDNSLVLLAL